MTPWKGFLSPQPAITFCPEAPANDKSISPKPWSTPCKRFGWKGRAARKTAEEMPYSSVSGVWCGFFSSCIHPALVEASSKLNRLVPSTVPRPPRSSFAKLVHTNNADGLSFLTSASTCFFVCSP